MADALEFEHKYTSGVIAWAPEDNPSDAQIGRVVDEFEETAWAAVQHREAGGGADYRLFEPGYRNMKL